MQPDAHASLTVTSTAWADTSGAMRIPERCHDLTGMVEVNVEKAPQLQAALEDAVGTVSAAAVEYRVGILITRIDALVYVVRAHPAVPFGLIRQQYYLEQEG